MLKRVWFRNYKALRAVDVELSRLTVFVGPNASGKTSILDGLDYAARTLRPPKPAAPADRPSALRSRGAKGDIEIGWEADQERYRIRVSSRTGGGNGTPGDGARGKEPDYDVRIEKALPEAVDRWDQITETSEALRVLPPAVLLRLDPRELAAPSHISGTLPSLAATGRGLASVLADMKLKQDAAFAELQDALRSVVPQARRLRFEWVPVFQPESEATQVSAGLSRSVNREYWAPALLLDAEGATDIPADLLGEGTLLVLGLLAVLMSPSRPRLILFDDLGRGLHPCAQKAVVALLRRVLERDERLQVLATSHSPFLLDHFQPDEVRLTNLLPDGSVACCRLAEHPEFAKWQDEMSPGEFWSHVGESWVGQTRGEQREMGDLPVLLFPSHGDPH
jgi:hypothetical protein